MPRINKTSPNQTFTKKVQSYILKKKTSNLVWIFSKRLQLTTIPQSGSQISATRDHLSFRSRCPPTLGSKTKTTSTIQQTTWILWARPAPAANPDLPSPKTNPGIWVTKPFLNNSMIYYLRKSLELRWIILKAIWRMSQLTPLSRKLTKMNSSLTNYVITILKIFS